MLGSYTPVSVPHTLFTLHSLFSWHSKCAVDLNTCLIKNFFFLNRVFESSSKYFCVKRNKTLNVIESFFFLFPFSFLLSMMPKIVAPIWCPKWLHQSIAIKTHEFTTKLLGKIIYWAIPIPFYFFNDEPSVQWGFEPYFRTTKIYFYTLYNFQFKKLRLYFGGGKRMPPP